MEVAETDSAVTRTAVAVVSLRGAAITVSWFGVFFAVVVVVLVLYVCL